MKVTIATVSDLRRFVAQFATVQLQQKADRGFAPLCLRPIHPRIFLEQGSRQNGLLLPCSENILRG